LSHRVPRSIRSARRRAASFSGLESSPFATSLRPHSAAAHASARPAADYWAALAVAVPREERPSQAGFHLFPVWLVSGPRQPEWVRTLALRPAAAAAVSAA